MSPGKASLIRVAKHPRLTHFEKTLQNPMLFLSFLWLCVLIMELVNGPDPKLTFLGTTLWFTFVLYFLLRLVTTTNRKNLLKKNWVFILAILATILRFFPELRSHLLVRSITVTFGIQVIWIFASAEQGVRFIHRALGRRGVGYVLTLTAILLFAASAAILHFESESTSDLRIQSYLGALWWTAMQMTNIGSSYALKTPWGKFLGLMVSIYSAGMFGYLTALFASLIIDRDTKPPSVDLALQHQLEDLKADLAQLHSLLNDKSPPAEAIKA